MFFKESIDFVLIVFIKVERDVFYVRDLLFC